MSNDPWFESCEGGDLAQGDLLSQCHVLKWQAEDIAPGGEIDATEVATDAIIITQSCDLDNDGKTDYVLLAELTDYDQLVREHPREKYGSKEFRANCARGRYPKMILLPPFEGPPHLNWSIVDFSHLYTLPKSVVSDHAGSMGMRIRMRSPYREHLSQSFARYFMRVGLPEGLGAFDRYTPNVTA